MLHKTVLLKESISGLDIKSGEIFVDATLGNGGHSAGVCENFKNEVKIVGLDADEDALARSTKRLQGMKCDFIPVHSNFKDLDKALDYLKISKVNKILFDLGLSSNQLEESGRGFSFQKDEPLQMTFKKYISSEDLTAEKIVNEWTREDIAHILKEYGEERFAWKIAGAIVESREKKAIRTTRDLVEVIENTVPGFYKRRRINPATKTFQALRMTVNDEVGALNEGIQKGFERLASGGRMAVISFHSIEDRIVKKFFKDLEKNELGKILTKKPIIAMEDEVSENPRSRSAKLRIISKI